MRLEPWRIAYSVRPHHILVAVGKVNFLMLPKILSRHPFRNFAYIPALSHKQDDRRRFSVHHSFSHIIPADFIGNLPHRQCPFPVRLTVRTIFLFFSAPDPAVVGHCLFFHQPVILSPLPLLQPFFCPLLQSCHLILSSALTKTSAPHLPYLVQWPQEV